MKYKINYSNKIGGSSKSDILPMITLPKGTQMLFVDTKKNPVWSGWFSADTVLDLSVILNYKIKYLKKKAEYEERRWKEQSSQLLAGLNELDTRRKRAQQKYESQNAGAAAQAEDKQIYIYHVRTKKAVTLVHLNTNFTPEKLDTYLDKEHIIKSRLWDNYSTREVLCEKGFMGWYENKNAEPHRLMGTEIMLCKPEEIIEIIEVMDLITFFKKRQDEIDHLLEELFDPNYKQEILDDLVKGNTKTATFIGENLYSVLNK